MTSPQGMRWSLTHRHLASATLSASIAHWKPKITSMTSPFMTSDQRRISHVMSIQVFVKYVWAGRLHLTHLVTLAQTDHLGITDDVVLIADTHIQRRPSFEGANAPSMTLRWMYFARIS